MPDAAGDARRVPAPRVGVLALQGDHALHGAALAALGCAVTWLRTPSDLVDVEALVLPGGESSTQLRLLAATGLGEPLAAAVRALPVLGTCAGAILLARTADRLPLPTFARLDLDCARNAYGRQVHSFEDALEFLPLRRTLRGVFIRAPRFVRIGDAEIIARRGDEPVGVRSGNAVALAFHPELTSEHGVHRWFLEQVAGCVLPDAVAAEGTAGR